MKSRNYRRPGRATSVGSVSTRTVPIGRTAELDAVRRALATSSRCTITGPGGVGKTTIATVVASDQEPTVWIDAAAFASCDALYAQVAEALGVGMTASEPAAQVCRDTVEQWSGLVVLDAVEHLAGELGDEVGRWAVSPAGGRLLITSRRPLTAQVLPVVRLTPLPITARTPESTPAGQLLMRQIEARGGDTQPLRSEPGLMHRLLDLTGGLPLAIELLAEQVARLGAHLAVTQPAVAGDAVLDSVTRSLALLPTQDASLFHRLGLSVGELSPDDLSMFSDRPSGEVLASAERLLDIGLLRTQGRALGILTPLRDSALHLLRTAGHYDHALGSVVRRAISSLDQDRESHRAGPPLDLLVHLARLAAAAPTQQAEAMKLVEQLQEPLYRRMRLREALSLLQTVFDNSDLEHADPRRSTRLAIRAARAASESDTIARAESWLDRAKRSVAQVDDLSLQCRIWSLQAGFCLDAGRLAEATIALRRARTLAQEAGDQPALHHVAHLTAECALSTGDLDEAETVAQQAFLASQHGNPAEALVLRTTLGWCLVERGRVAEAGAHARRLRHDIAIWMGHDSEIGVDAELITIAADPTSPATAAPLSEDAPWWMRLHQRIRLAARLPIAAHWPEVMKTAADVVVLSDLVPIASARIAANTLLGDAALESGDQHQAGTAYLSALRDAVRGPYRLRAADALDGIATLLSRTGRQPLARDTADTAAAIRDRCGAHPWPRPSLQERITGSRSAPAGWLRDGIPTVQAVDALAQHVLRPSPRKPIDSLTRTEQLVAHLVAEGRSNQEIAQELTISRRTVESHLTHAYLKLGIKSRTQLAAHVRQT